MAKLSIAADLLLAEMFPDHGSLTLRGVWLDPVSGVVTLDIEGPDVPEVDAVFAEIRVRSRRTVFLPVANGAAP